MFGVCAWLKAGKVMSTGSPGTILSMACTGMLASTCSGSLSGTISMIFAPDWITPPMVAMLRLCTTPSMGERIEVWVTS
ncbi:hypothetical protein D3C78_1262970 [compost metagenome]